MVGVLPAYATILLVQTDDVLDGQGISFIIAKAARKVLDCAETVAAYGQIVGAASSSSIPEVEGLFAVIRTAWVYVECQCIVSLNRLCVALASIRYGHLTHAEPVEDRATIIPDIMYSETLSIIETNSESPFLPMHAILIENFETWTLGL